MLITSRDFENYLLIVCMYPYILCGVEIYANTCATYVDGLEVE